MCGVIWSSCSHGPIVKASRTTIQPFGVLQVVWRTFVPGTYTRLVGWWKPNGANRKNPAWRSSRLPNTLGASNRGTQSQSIAPSGATSAPVWQLERNAYSAMGGNGDGVAALCTPGCCLREGGHAVTLQPESQAVREREFMSGFALDRLSTDWVHQLACGSGLAGRRSAATSPMSPSTATATIAST